MTDMPAACAECKGACCEDVLLPIDLREEIVVDYFSARGRIENLGGRPQVILKAPCPQLVDGACGCHEAKPLACQQYPVGGPGCLDAIRRNRPDQAERLLDLAKPKRKLRLL